MSEQASTSEQSKRRTAQFFSSLAPVYGTVTSYFEHYGARLVTLAGIKPGMRVLDVAAGKGSSARPARELGAEVVPVDLAEGMVEHLRSLGFEARVMDAEHLDFPDDSFDAVLCGFGIFFLPDPAQGAREFRRVVKPGGPVACSMPLRVFPDWVSELRREYQVRACGRELPGPDPAFDGAAALRAGGFAEVRTVDEPLEVPFGSGEHFLEFVMATGASELMARLEPDDGAELRERLLAGAGHGPFSLSTAARFWLTSG